MVKNRLKILYAQYAVYRWKNIKNKKIKGITNLHLFLHIPLIKHKLKDKKYKETLILYKIYTDNKFAFY